jgi:hypothetical protein
VQKTHRRLPANAALIAQLPFSAAIKAAAFGLLEEAEES